MTTTRTSVRIAFRYSASTSVKARSIVRGRPRGNDGLWPWRSAVRDAFSPLVEKRPQKLRLSHDKRRAPGGQIRAETTPRHTVWAPAAPKARALATTPHPERGH